MFDHIAIKMPSKCNLDRNNQQWYILSCCSDVCPFMTKFESAQLIKVNFEVVSLYCYVCHTTTKWSRHYIIWPLMVQYDLIYSIVSMYGPEYEVWTI